MSKLYDLLNSVVAKLKATEKSVPKKVSDLEQDVKTSWNELEGKPFGEETEWIVSLDEQNVLHNIPERSATVYKYDTVNTASNVRIVYDNVEYTSAVTHSGTTACMGNGSLASWSGYTTIEDAPFFIRANSTYFIANFEDGGTHSLTVYVAAPVVTAIDPKFIPDTIARKEDIPEAFSGSYNDLTDKPEIPDHTWESLPDKPFGEEIWESVYEDETFTHNAMIFRDKSDVITKEQVLKIVVDGVEYMTPVKYVNGIPMGYFAGNGELFVAFNSGNVSLDADEYGTLPGSPFHIRHTGGQAASILFADQSSHVVSVYESAGQSTLDPKFLPIDAITQSVIDALPTAEGGSF